MGDTQAPSTSNPPSGNPFATMSRPSAPRSTPIPSTTSYDASNEAVDDGAAVTSPDSPPSGGSFNASRRDTVVPAEQRGISGEQSAVENDAPRPPGTHAAEPFASTSGSSALSASATDSPIERVSAPRISKSEENSTSQSQNQDKSDSSRPGASSKLSSSKESLHSMRGSHEPRIPSTAHNPAPTSLRRLEKQRSSGSRPQSSHQHLSACNIRDSTGRVSMSRSSDEDAGLPLTSDISSSSIANVERDDENGRMIENPQMQGVNAKDASRKKRRFEKMKRFLMTVNTVRLRSPIYVERGTSDRGSAEETSVDSGTAVLDGAPGGNKTNDKRSKFTLSGLRTRFKRPAVTSETFQDADPFATPDMSDACPPDVPKQANNGSKNNDADSLRSLNPDDQRRTQSFLKSGSTTNISPLRRVSNYASLRRSSTSSPLSQPRSTIVKSSIFNGPFGPVPDTPGAGNSQDDANETGNTGLGQAPSSQEFLAGTPNLSSTPGKKHRWLSIGSISKLFDDSNEKKAGLQ